MGKAVNALAARIATLADQCVKCGLCLPHCPTYRVGRSEAESPRGRIALAQALAQQQLEPTPTLTAHLDQCLVCLHCERVCPSHVRYGELIVKTRILLREHAPPRPRRKRWLAFLLAHLRWLRAVLRMANLPLISHVVRSRALQQLLPSRIRRPAQELPRLPRARMPSAPRPTSSRGRIGVFLGCVASVADRDVHASAIRLLTALGYEPVLPKDQGCCGALALHAGDSIGASALAAKLRCAFEGIDTVLVSSSGCFGTLRDQAFANAAVRVCEIHEFLDHDPQLGALRLRPLAVRVAVHTPCTQKTVGHADPAIRRLLGRIPQLEIADLPDQPGCCGAAGDYFLGHAPIADALRAEKLDQVQALRPDLLVTSNVGCRIFLDNGLSERRAAISVTHPIVLLAQQLDN